MLVGGVMMGFQEGGYPFDVLSAVPACGFSLRKLSAKYNGPCIKVRRSSDNTAMDIGFASGVLNTVALKAFVGTGTGYVTTWYNQGSLGSSGNATQTTAASQPIIVSAGTIQTQNGKPSIICTTGYQSSYLLIGTALLALIGTTAGASFNIVHYPVSNTNNVALLGALSSGQYRAFLESSSSTISVSYNGGSLTFSITLSKLQILTNVYGTSLCSAYSNGANASSAAYSANTAVSDSFAIGESGGVYNWAGSFSEVIIINGEISTTDRQSLEHGQENFYSISGV